MTKTHIGTVTFSTLNEFAKFIRDNPAITFEKVDTADQPDICYNIYYWTM